LVADGNVFFKDIVNGNGKGLFGISFAAFSGFDMDGIQNGATFSLDGSSDNNDLFKIENNVLKFKDANCVDYDTTSLKVYTIHIKARKSGKADAKKTLTVTMDNVFEKDIAIGNQARSEKPSPLPAVMAKVAIVPEVTRGSPMPVFMTEFSLTDRAWLPMAMSFSKTLLMVTVRVFLASALPLFLALSKTLTA
jgi:hypothetical protein